MSTHEGKRSYIQLLLSVISAMFNLQYIKLICISKFILLSSGHCMSLQHHKPAKITFSSIVDATMTAIQPIISAGSNRCEAFKSFFGLTYEQMLQKNSTDFNEVLNIDLITKKGNLKYNLTATKRLNRIMSNAQTIVILIHGFLESSEGWMVNAIAPEFLNHSRFKVFALDGRKIINLEYFRSSTYVRFMGEILGNFLTDIVRNGQDPSKIYLIGHSLGSHIAGAAGKRVRSLTGKLLGRITALDPAGPCFTNVSSAGRVDKADAAYVDIIHTNAGMLGLKEPVGHKDFYPNGGNSQPGCFLSICDHSRAWEFFAESINSPKHFPARKCENWTIFAQGSCSKDEVVYMGLNSETGSPGVYFLSTNRSIPFGLGTTGSG